MRWHALARLGNTDAASRGCGSLTIIFEIVGTGLPLAKVTGDVFKMGENYWAALERSQQSCPWPELKIFPPET